MANGPLAKISQIWLWDTLGQEGVAVGIDHREHSAQEAQWLLDEKPKPFFFWPLGSYLAPSLKEGIEQGGIQSGDRTDRPKKASLLGPSRIDISL